MSPYKDPEAQRAYQAGWMAGVRRAWLEANGPCVQCGSWDGLQVDHIDPAQKETHRIWSLAKPKREEELAKCQVLCAACHKEKTRAMLSKPVQHGTESGYSHYRCRCRPCTDAHAAAQRRYKLTGSKAEPKDTAA